MDDHFVGYLLEALDAQTQERVEGYLRAHPEAAHRLESLRQAMAPLEGDREDPEVPTGLRFQTLARIAELECRKLPLAPVLSRSQVKPRFRWRRADVLVAA